MLTVHTLTNEEVPEVVDILCESFFDYPVMRFVLGDSSGDYEKRLGTLIHFFVMARALRREFLIGVGDRANLDGAAIVSCPAGPGSPPQLAKLREQVWAELGLGVLRMRSAMLRNTLVAIACWEAIS